MKTHKRLDQEIELSAQQHDDNMNRVDRSYEVLPNKYANIGALPDLNALDENDVPLIDEHTRAYIDDGSGRFWEVIVDDNGNKVWLPDNRMQSNVGNLEYSDNISASSTTFVSTSISKVNKFKSDNPQEAIINAGMFSLNDEIYLSRNGNGSVELKKGTNVRLSGVRDIENKFFVNDLNSWVVAKFMEMDGSIEVWQVLGNLTRGSIGAVQITSYTTLIDNGTAQDVVVMGQGFSENMRTPVLTGNATLNSWTYVDSTEIVLNITENGSVGDNITVTYDNGDVFEDVDAITIEAVPASAFYYDDDFNDNTLDASWNRSGTSTYINEINGRIEVNLPHTTGRSWNDLNESIVTTNSVSSGVLVAQISLTYQNETTNGGHAPFGIFKNGSQSSGLLNGVRVFASGSTAGEIRVAIGTGGALPYLLDTGISALTEQIIKIKYTFSTNLINIYYWDGSQWVELDASTSKVYDLHDGGTMDAYIAVNDGTSFNGVDFAYYDNFFLHNADYTTQTP